jgi:magnesium transporter
MHAGNHAPTRPPTESERLGTILFSQGPDALLAEIGGFDPAAVARVLDALNSGAAIRLYDHLDEAQQLEVLEAMDPRVVFRLANARIFPERSVGRVMYSPRISARPDDTVGATIEKVGAMDASSNVFVVWVVEHGGTLAGWVRMQDLVTHAHAATMASVMHATVPLVKATDALFDVYRRALSERVLEYAVRDDRSRFVGTLRADVLFREASLELGERGGESVGVDRDERLSTPVRESLVKRLPWLVLNLGTCFLPAAIVVLFEGTLKEFVLLASFLTVLVGQTINAGEQALAVMVRAMTFADIKTIRLQSALAKEFMVGLLQGLVCGPIAGIGMYVAVVVKQQPEPMALAVATAIATLLASIIAGLCGTATPWILKKFGFDPALTSHIALTTVTDVASIALLLGLAQWLVPLL